MSAVEVPKHDDDSSGLDNIQPSGLLPPRPNYAPQPLTACICGYSYNSLWYSVQDVQSPTWKLSIHLFQGAVERLARGECSHRYKCDAMFDLTFSSAGHWPQFRKLVNLVKNDHMSVHDAIVVVLGDVYTEHADHTKAAAAAAARRKRLDADNERRRVKRAKNRNQSD